MKKILSLLLILTLAVGIFVGCGEKEGIEAAKEMTTQEVFDKVQEVSQEMTNASFLADFNLELTGLEDLGIAGPMGLTMTGDIKDVKNMKMSIDIDTGMGFAINGDIYLVDETILIHAPILQQFMGYAYLKADINTLAEQAGTPMTQPDPAALKAVLERFEVSTEYSIYDVFKLNENKEVVDVVVDEKTIEATKLTMDVNLENADEIIFALVDFIINDEEAKELFLSTMTDEDIADIKEQMANEESRAELKTFINALQINEFNIVMYADADYQTIKTEIAIDVTITDPDSEETFSIKLSGFMDYFNIGQVGDIVLPEVDPTEILDINDMY